MSNVNTKHSRHLRAMSAHDSRQRILNAGGRRLDIMLEQPYAEVIDRLGLTCGNRKLAVKFLIDFYLKHEAASSNGDTFP